MAQAIAKPKKPRTVSLQQARATLGQLLAPADGKPQSFLIEKRGAPVGMVLTIRDYMKLAAPEPDILRILHEETRRSGANELTSRQIDKLIQETRAERKKR